MLIELASHLTRKFNMKYLESLIWVTNVWWVEKDCPLEWCLVDTLNLDSEEGHMLIETNGQLEIYSAIQLKKSYCRQQTKILGKVLQRMVSF